MKILTKNVIKIDNQLRLIEVGYVKELTVCFINILNSNENATPELFAIYIQNDASQ